MYGDDKIASGCAPVPVIHRVGERFRQKVAGAQSLDDGQAVVQRIGIGSVGIEAEVAVLPCRICLRQILGGVVCVDVLRRGQNACGVVLVFKDGGGGGIDSGRVIEAIDGNGDSVGGGAARAVAYSIGEGFGK